MVITSYCLEGNSDIQPFCSYFTFIRSNMIRRLLRLLIKAKNSMTIKCQCNTRYLPYSKMSQCPICKSEHN